MFNGLTCYPNHAMNDKIAVRDLVESDCSVIADAFAAQGWNKPASQYLDYWRDSALGKRDVLLAEYDGRFAGYTTIVWKSDYPPFDQAGIPETVDFNVLLKYRRLGIGTALMDAAEKRIASQSPVAGLGVCVHSDYGAAQVLYIKRGYIPDGRGVFYQGHHPAYFEQVQIGDDLALYMTKQLRPG